MVRYDDLAEPLEALGRACGTGLSTVLAASHLKVLSMLSEEAIVRTDVLTRDQGVRAIEVRTDAAGTWRDLAGLVSQVLAVPEQAREGGDESRAYEAVFTAGDPSAAAAPRYGLCAGMADGALLVRASSVREDCLPRLASLYRQVLEAMAQDPAGDAARACLPPGERDAVLTRWGAGPVVARGSGTVVELFRAQAARTPGNTAVSAPEGCLTYRELDQQSDRLAWSPHWPRGWPGDHGRRVPAAGR